MKSKTIKNTSARQKKTSARKSFSEVLRASRRFSPYAFAATAGVWLPQFSDAATLVNLDVTGYTLGPANTLTNTGTWPGDFNSVGAIVPGVSNIDGVHAVAMLDLSTAAAGGGQQYAGPTVPPVLGGAGKRTVEAWIFDPGPRLNAAAVPNYQFEKTIFSFGRRAVANGNFVLEHGLGEDLGAVSTALEQAIPPAFGCIGWNGQQNVTTNAWIYIVASYDGTTLSVYSDGVLRNSETYAPYVKAINTTLVSNGNGNTNTLMRIARQTADAGTTSGAGIGPFYLGRLRVQDTNMTDAQVLAQYNAEKAAFNYTDSDSNGLADWWEMRYFGALGQNPAADPDGDGATNLQESNAGSNPLVGDTDGDGLSDGQEINTYLTDPTKADTDGDGLSDGYEVNTSLTNPLVADSDGDGFSDGVEVRKGTNPNNASSFPIAVVNLDATALPLGRLTNWVNTGSIGGTFDSVSATNQPSVSNIFGVKGVNFVSTGGNANGTSYIGPAVPTQLTGAGARTIEAWVYNSTIQDEETMFSWGARGGNTAPDGKNVSFGMGRNANFAAVAQWGQPDIGWNNQEVYGRWVNLAYTYDPTNNTSRVYVDGKLANSDVSTAPSGLVTLANGVDGQPYHFRMARQNVGITTPANTGSWTNIDGTGTGEFTMSRIRVYDVTFDAATLQAHFNAEKATYKLIDTDGDGMPDWFEDAFGLNKNSAADASQTNALSDISNLAKYQAGYRIPSQGTAATIALDPTKPDFDGDGVKDGAELGRIGGHYRPGQFAPTNPFNKDTDGDGLTDGVETDTGVLVSPLNTGTDPLTTDSDVDGASDGQEIAQGSNPNDPLSLPSPLPIINLNATTNALGSLLVWTNTGRIGGNFTNENGGGSIQSVQGVNGLTMPGLSSYIGPAATPLSGNANFTVEAWVYNPTIEPEETLIGWGRRGGGTGTMSALTDGNAAGFGAMTHWAADLSWNGANARTPNRWKYLAYTYNGGTLAQTNYTDSGTSVIIGSGNVLGAPLVVVDSLDDGVTHLPFRVGDETGGNGAPATANLPGFSLTGTIGLIRVYTRVVPLSELQSNFTADAATFGVLDDDGDGMPTWWERAYGFNPFNAADGSADPDGDGLTNAQEYNSGNNSTNPLLADSDGDGLNDGQEASIFSNPNNADTSIDGLPDGRAVALGLDPRFRDSDGDGFDDATEVLYGSDPLDFNSMPDTSIPRPFVNLDATSKPIGPLATWTNNNALGWSFKAPTNAVASVQIVDGSRAVVFNGTNYYTGLGEPYSFATNASRTVEAWIWNPTVEDEETVFAWSRRGGPDGSNNALSHGRNAAFGAIQFWGGADLPWGTNATQIVSNTPAAKWSHIAFTYDNTTSNRVCYLNGNVANSSTSFGPLNTWLFDPTDPLNNRPNPIGRSLPFRVGCQNDAGGQPSVPFASMAIARVKAFNTALSAAQIAADYNAERVDFPGAPRITNVAVNQNTGVISFDWTPNPSPTHSYRVETNSDLGNPNGWGIEASGLTSGPYSSPASSSAKFYRLRVD